MAFNVLHTFQRNKRFWMAVILMVCMVSFVFCAGGAPDKLPTWLAGRGGATVFQIGGHNYGTQQLYDLRTQRNLANKLLINCSDMAIKKLTKQYFDGNKKQDGTPKEIQARAERQTEILGLRQSLAYKKSRPRYFEGGVKYDDLVEFTMWLAVADKLGIYLDEEHVTLLFLLEIYAQRVPMDADDIGAAERQTLADFRDANRGTIRKAIADEFRVRIAQEAVLLSQPLQFSKGSRKQDGIWFKLVDPDVPDEVRAPITLAQLWEQYKQSRAEFDVTLIPLDVDKFVKKIQAEPTEAEKEAFFETYKDKAADPSFDARGLQMPVRVKIEYLLADAASPAYLDSAKAFERLKVSGPFAPDIVLSPVATAARYWAAQSLHRIDLENQYENLGKNERRPPPFTSPYDERDCTTPILARLANRHPQAGAHLVGNTLLTPADGLGALAGYLAWGATPEHKEELDLALGAELKRRVPIYATVFAASASGYPFDLITPYHFMNLTKTQFEEAPWLPFRPKLPLEAVQKEIEDILSQRAAEEKAQQNMQIVRAALEKADGDPEKFKRDLNKFVPEMKLTYGPADKSGYVTRYSADTAPDLESLRKAYLKNLDTINFFEGRDVTPERLLKPNDFYKLFFDTSESFSAATPYRAMPWPPRVKANSARMLKENPDPKQINRLNINPATNAEFMEQLKKQNPQQQGASPSFDGLFNKDEKPILFWRTVERIPQRPSKYADIAKEITAREAEVKLLQTNIKKQAELAPQVEALRKKEAELEKAKADPKEIDKVRTVRRERYKALQKLQTEAGGDLKTLGRKESDLKEDVADLKEVQRLVVVGWKFDRARANEVLPAAKVIADTLIKTGKQHAEALAKKYDEEVFSIKDLSAMVPEKTPDDSMDYGKLPLAKYKLLYPRDDMADQLVSLDDLNKPIKLGNDEIYKTNKELADLDKLNDELFEQVKKGENPRGNYVQILTNKPRSVYYVAFVSTPATAKKDRFLQSLGLAAPWKNLDERRFRLELYKMTQDRWVQRIQQKDGRAYRAALVLSLKTTLHYEELSAEGRKQFDDRVVGD